MCFFHKSFILCSLGSKELHYLYILLNTCKDPKSYDKIKIVDGIMCGTFKDACYALGLLDEDNEYIDSIIESSHWRSAKYLRQLFVTLIISNSITRPKYVWRKAKMHLFDDMLYRH